MAVSRLASSFLGETVIFCCTYLGRYILTETFHGVAFIDWAVKDDVAGLTGVSG